MTIEELDELIKAVCPIHGINTNGDICFKDEATQEQRVQAQEIMQSNLTMLTS